MPISRTRFHCGVAFRDDGEEEVVTFGGRKDHKTGAEEEVFIYNVKQDLWRTAGEK